MRLPSFKALRSRTGLWTAITNTAWLMGDKVLRFGGGLLVGLFIARHLGPEQFGLWNYALAFATIFGALASLGLDSIIVRDIVRDPPQRQVLLATGCLLKLAAGICALAGAAAAITLVRPGEPMTLLLVCLSGLGFVFQAALVADLDFQAQSRNRVSVVAQNSAFLLMAVVKICLLVIEAPLLAFAVAGAVEVALGMVFLLTAFFWWGGRFSLAQARWTVAKRLMSDSWPLMIGGIAVVIYMRIDQVMLGAILDDQTVGVYSAAVRLSEAWYFIPMSISTAVFPAIVALRERDPEIFRRRLQRYFDIMFVLALAPAIVVTFVGQALVTALFGQAYAAAGPLLVLHIWAGIFVSLGVASSSWLAAEDLQTYSLIRTVLGCASNITLNLALIPAFGALGAVIGTLISFGLATYALLFFPRTRACGYMLLKALLPIRLLLRKSLP